MTTPAAGSGGTGALYYNVDGSAGSYFEAETFTSKSGSFIDAACAACSNGHDIETPNGSGDSASNLIAYTIDVTNGGGTHTLYIKVREDGAKVDKICLSKSSTSPTGLGGASLTPSYQ